MNKINNTKWANKALEIDDADIVTADGFANDLTKYDSKWARTMLEIDDADIITADGFAFVPGDLKKIVSQ